ncbi:MULTISPECIES: DUF5682 family protein [unclassified Acinetobacter]|uniref:DUF5682 family protein n=1 Tax=unclassified Acinetobacter TaxID=196816 RepID=UPI002448B84E|nr:MULTISPECIES: DUF5682 family protein [unclassified Acinetobacter]MDH0030483.1 DUF5682 family protein [Acinetobacter sp. GD04021]MDH0885628.1 DUF5682 family protein [Acinetobacter sp. GD03873]MDH1082056.1 DUF5682 family protein [Acinetobacter sp. GD03983]MDH2188914.1 DUF5682 family protein [Acinetobacter sp. GD03645]MDH2202525.1 DUF5682 family protein [Acinetobacter sp. GD03647]
MTIPQRLRQALEWQKALAEKGIHFLPIRHHSPACAYATLQALQQLQATHVLIEAPRSFNRLIADLQHPDSQPPLAVLCQTEIIERNVDAVNEETIEQKQSRTAYYPFCDYSPEWVALRYAPEINAKVEFIDLAWSSQVEHELQAFAEQTWQSRSLQQERYLAHSQYLQALAHKLHCRNHDELWDHLFELKPKQEMNDWQNFFHEVLVWCAMSRLDYEDSVLETDASLIREQCMLQSILECYENNKGTICIITGGFHTLALIEELAAQILTTKPKKIKKIKSADQEDQAWLIRYSFDRLDALNGYASGMPSPAFYQRCWQQMMDDSANEVEQRQTLTVELLSDFSRQLREQQILDSSFITVKNATEQAIRLATLREHHLISRFDLIDACQSSFVKGSLDEGQQAFQHLLRQILSGAHLGQVVQSTQTPPLLAQVYELAKIHRFKLDETTSKRAKLDVFRNQKHRLRSRFLHLLDFLQVGFAKSVSGPDFLGGGRLHLLFEEWDYAWTPHVEARLIELSELGSDLNTIAIKKLLQLKETFCQSGQGRSSHLAVQLLIRAALMGLHKQIPILFAEVQQYLPNDPDLDSVIQCGQKLLNLWTGKDFLAFQQQPELKALLQQVIPSALFLLSQLATPPADQQQQILNQVLQLRNLSKQIQRVVGGEADLLAQFYQTLARLHTDWQKLDVLAGAVDALRFIDGDFAELDLQQSIQQHFGIGASPEHAVAYLSGMMQSAPELLLRYPAMAQLLNQLLLQWDEAAFVTILPDLRQAFTHFKPKETAAFAEQIAQLNDVSSLDISQYISEVSQAEMLQGVQLNQQLQQFLVEQNLQGWLA